MPSGRGFSGPSAGSQAGSPLTAVPAWPTSTVTDSSSAVFHVQMLAAPGEPLPPSFAPMRSCTSAGSSSLQASTGAPSPPLPAASAGAAPSGAGEPVTVVEQPTTATATTHSAAIRPMIIDLL